LRRGKEEDVDVIQKNIDTSLKLGKNDMVNPNEKGIKNSLFFRTHVSGIIESANVKHNNNYLISFTKETLFIVNTISFTVMIGKKKMGKYQDRVNLPVKAKVHMIILCGICRLNVVLEV
jgi:hypothetical protein